MVNHRTFGQNQGSQMREANQVCAVICTRERPDKLRRALNSLVAQVQPPAQILVVDNAPGNDASRKLVRKDFPSVAYVKEPIPGLDFARNRALRETGASIVAFLDDDAVADPCWISETATVFQNHPQVVICTGKVDALTLESEGQQLIEANGGFGRGERTIHLPHDVRRLLHGFPAPLIAWTNSVGSGCSMAVRREFVLGLGGFDEGLDMGPPLPGGGDFDMLWRVLDAGSEIVYEPKVKARHEHRAERDAAVLQILEHNRALIAVLVKSLQNTNGIQRIGIFSFLLWRLAKPGVRIVRRAMDNDPLTLRELLRLWFFCWRGLTSYSAARRLAQQLRTPGSRQTANSTRR